MIELLLYLGVALMVYGLGKRRGAAETLAQVEALLALGELELRDEYEERVAELAGRN